MLVQTVQVLLIQQTHRGSGLSRLWWQIEVAIAFKTFLQFSLFLEICNFTWHQIANDQAHKIAMLQFKTKALCHFSEVSCMNGQSVALFKKHLSTTGSSNKPN